MFSDLKKCDGGAFNLTPENPGPVGPLPKPVNKVIY